MSSSFGLRFAILIAAWTNGIGGAIRLIRLDSFLELLRYTMILLLKDICNNLLIVFHVFEIRIRLNL